MHFPIPSEFKTDNNQLLYLFANELMYYRLELKAISHDIIYHNNLTQNESLHVFSYI